MTYFACQWLITIIVVWLYDDLTSAGYLGLAMNISNFFATVALYNIRIFQVSDIRCEYNDSEYVVTRVLTCAAAILLCAVFVFIVDFTAKQRLIVLCYMVFRVNEAFLEVFHGINQKNWRMDYIGISLAARGIAMLAAFVLLGRLFGLLPSIIGMAIITILIGVLYDIPKTKTLARYTAYAGKQVLSLLKRCFPLMLVILAGTLIVSFSRYSVERIHGTDALGAYSSVSAPTFVIQIAASLLFVPLTNIFAECLKEGNKAKFVKIFALAFAIIAGITLAFVAASLFFGEWGLSILYDGDLIIPYAYLLPGVAIASGLTSLIWYMNLLFSATRDIKGLLAGVLIGVAICLATTDFFLNRYGLIGANNVMIISQGVAVICLTVRLLWFIKNKQGLFANKGFQNVTGSGGQL